MAFYHFTDLIKEHPYYKSVSFKVKRLDGKFSHGCLFTLCDKITIEERKRLAEFDNVKMFASQSMYAPEQIHSAIFIGKSAINGRF